MQYGEDNPHDNSAEPDEDEAPSKSERKRQMLRLQEMGAALLEFAPSAIENLPLSGALHEALAQARAARKHGARKRLLQFIGKLMRSESPEAIAQIAQLLSEDQAGKAAARQRLHECEGWRDRILADGVAAINDLVEQFPAADRQKLRQLHRQHQQELARGAPPAAARKLFSYLREVLET